MSTPIEDIVIHSGGPRAQALVLLFHGVGASAGDLVPLGQAIAAALPDRRVVSVNAPHRCDLGRGYQWFSVSGVTEANRPERVAQAMPSFLATVGRWQREAGIGPERTDLIGFSQGAIMALASTQSVPGCAHRVVAIAGRFSRPPQHAPRDTVVHLLHGQQDGVIPVAQGVEAAEHLRRLGVPVTLDVLPGLGHGIDDRVTQRVVSLLSLHAMPSAPREPTT